MFGVTLVMTTLLVIVSQNGKRCFQCFRQECEELAIPSEFIPDKQSSYDIRIRDGLGGDAIHKRPGLTTWLDPWIKYSREDFLLRLSDGYPSDKELLEEVEGQNGFDPNKEMLDADVDGPVDIKLTFSPTISRLSKERSKSKPNPFSIEPSFSSFLGCGFGGCQDITIGTS